MGREATITAEQVAAAADALKGEGKKPTSRAVRERLGNTGSMGTITKLLQRWKSHQERDQVASLSLPPALQRAVLDFMDTELAAARAPLETELVDLKESIDELATENERQEDALTGLREQLDQVAAEKASAEGKAAQLTADLDGARDEAGRERQAAELARTELAKAQLRLEAMPRLEADLEAVRTELTKERSARVAAEQQAAVLAAQKTDLEGRLGDAKKDGERITDQLAKAQAKADQLAETVADARVKLQTAQARGEDLTQQLAKANQLAEALADARAKLQTAQSRGDDLTQQLTTAAKQLDQVRAEARSSSNEAAELRGRLGSDKDKGEGGNARKK